MGDEFVSVEPILLAIVQGNSTAARILKDAGANAKDMLAAIQALRQGQNVNHKALMITIRAWRNMRKPCRTGKKRQAGPSYRT